jgi:stress response protein YsnF
MNTSDRIQKIKYSIAVASSLLVVAGCGSTHHEARYQSDLIPVYTYNEQPGPGVAATGGTGQATQTETGTAATTTTTTTTATTGQPAAGGEVVIPLQKETAQVQTQPVSAGGVQVRKIVRTETVSQPVQVRKESVVVERIPEGGTGAATQTQTGGNTSLNTPFQAGEMTINLQNEQPVVRTQVVPAGSVVVRKQVTTQPMNVQQQVRREDVVATPVGGAQNVTIAPNVSGTAQPQNEAVGAAPQQTGQQAGQAAGAAESGAITQLDQLSTAPDPSTLAGKSVNIENAKVDKVVGDRMVVLSTSSGKPIYAVSSQPLSGISQGQQVKLSGTVEQVPPSPTSLGLDQEGANMLQGQQIFVKSTSITPSNQ